MITSIIHTRERERERERETHTHTHTHTHDVVVQEAIISLAFDSYAYAFPSLKEGKNKKDIKYRFDNFFVPKNQNKEKKIASIISLCSHRSS